MLEQYILVGQVLKPQGVDGLVKVRPDTEDPERFTALDHVFVKTGAQYKKETVSDISVRGGFVYLRLNGAQTRNDAEDQRDQMLYVDREHAKPLSQDEYFICDLIGCRAYDTTDNELGVMTEVMQPGANDVYVFRTVRGEMLVPVLKSVIVSVDVANKKIVLDENRLREVAVFDD